MKTVTSCYLTSSPKENESENRSENARCIAGLGGKPISEFQSESDKTDKIDRTLIGKDVLAHNIKRVLLDKVTTDSERKQLAKALDMVEGRAVMLRKQIGG
jgi:hypothetical protein